MKDDGEVRKEHGPAGREGPAGRRVLGALESTCGACPMRDRCTIASAEGVAGCRGGPEGRRAGTGRGARTRGRARRRKVPVMALAGNSNVGKSVIFNHLTDLDQTIGNWPGTTDVKAYGRLYHSGRTVTVADLPGIYSMSAYSAEENITRNFITEERPDVLVDVVDVTQLERNLFLTLQLLETGTPMVVALNQMDAAARKGIVVDVEGISRALGVPVVPTTATRGEGIHTLVHTALEVIDGCPMSEHPPPERDPAAHHACPEGSPAFPGYSRGLEKLVRQLARIIHRKGLHREKGASGLPPAYIAIRLLEGDPGMERSLLGKSSLLDRTLSHFRRKLSRSTGQAAHTAISSERYARAHAIWEDFTGITRPGKQSASEKLAEITTHPVAGYAILAAVVLGVFGVIIGVGSYLAGLLEGALFSVAPEDPAGLEAILWNGAYFGAVAGVSVALPYLLPFFILLAIMEDSGYLARVAFLMDSTMHKVGLHGKAIIPLILGYGCSVPAIMGTRIMEGRRERLIAAVAATMVPCSARTVVIMGLVAVFVGLEWALALYVFNLLVIFALGRLAYRFLPGEGAGLIMEMPAYRRPHPKIVLKQSWARLREFIVIAIPLIVVGSILLESLRVMGMLDTMAGLMSPVTVWWLGLPAVAGIVLLFGVLRKEVTLVMLAAMEKTTDFSKIMTPLQMVVFTLVVMFYVPCLATIAALVREFGWTKAVAISAGEIVLALVIGGVAFRVLGLVL